MNSLLRTAGAMLCAAAMLALNAPAHAVLVFQDASGSPVSAPSVLDAGNEAIYFTETAITGGGRYDVTNNTTGYGLFAFGISNSGTVAYVDTLGDTSDCFSSWCYDALNLNAANWDTEEIDFAGNTGSDIFGDISNVLDAGDTTLNFYRAFDGDLQPGDSWDGFLYGLGMPSSQLFVVLEGSDTIYGSGGQPVPEPGAALLLIGGLAGLAIRRSRLD